MPPELASELAAGLDATGLAISVMQISAGGNDGELAAEPATADTTVPHSVASALGGTSNATFAAASSGGRGELFAADGSGDGDWVGGTGDSSRGQRLEAARLVTAAGGVCGRGSAVASSGLPDEETGLVAGGGCGTSDAGAASGLPSAGSASAAECSPGAEAAAGDDGEAAEPAAMLRASMVAGDDGDGGISGAHSTESASAAAAGGIELKAGEVATLLPSPKTDVSATAGDSSGSAVADSGLTVRLVQELSVSTARGDSSGRAARAESGAGDWTADGDSSCVYVSSSGDARWLSSCCSLLLDAAAVRPGAAAACGAAGLTGTEPPSMLAVSQTSSPAVT